MVKFIKNNYQYFILFIFIFLIYSIFLFPNNYGDPLNNYGFSYAITRGELPYLDFNTISTPLYSFVMSIGLFIWNNYSMFLLEQSILVTIMFYLLNKLYGKKSYILLLGVCLLGGYGINATYNFFAFFMMIVLLFLEKKYSNKDYLIGIVIGLSILSKHTVGVLFILPSLIYYFKDKNKLLKRFIGLLGVGVIFIIYLLLTNSFMKFIDLCFLGLFDFSSKNGHLFNMWFFQSIILFIISIIITIKNRKDISNYYLLMGIGFVFPLFDLCHFSIYFLCILIQLLKYIKKYENYFGNLSFVLSIIVCVGLYINYYDTYKPIFNKKIKHFEYIQNGSYNYLMTNKYFNFFDRYDNKLLISYAKMHYDISRGNNIDYFDVLMYGNYGYNGSSKMIKRIDKMKDIYIILDKRGYLDKSYDSQFDKVVAEYIMNNYKKIDEKYDFLIYYKD